MEENRGIWKMNPPAELASAVRLHRAGEFNKAARLHKAILNRDPDQADALHFFGVLRQQQGDFADGVELGAKAVSLRPNDAQCHANLAEAYRGLRQFEQAVRQGAQSEPRALLRCGSQSTGTQWGAGETTSTNLAICSRCSRI
jgi:tetratricopeptide (TPR) repeat protein